MLLRQRRTRPVPDLLFALFWTCKSVGRTITYMSHQETSLNRRQSQRLPVGFYIEQIIEDEPHRSFMSDLSAAGLYMERPFELLSRRSNVVQVELPLPGDETLWAKCEVVYDRFDSLFHGTAVRFTAMARKHQRLLREWLRETSSEQRVLEPRRHAMPSTPEVKILRPSRPQALARINLIRRPA